MTKPAATDRIEELDLCGRRVPVLLRKSRRARRMTLRVDPTAGGANVILPVQGTFAQARAFALSHEVWIINKLADLPEPIPFRPGARIPVQGTEVEIRRHESRQPAKLTEDALYLAGEEEHIPRRTEDWLRKRAKEELSRAVRTYEEQLGVRASRITIRDTVSRWGSCSTTRNLSFSWRLIMAPPEVLDYVAAHETAHLLEMNHSNRFWALVDQCIEDRSRPEYWLKAKGPLLHVYGRAPLTGVPASGDLTDML